MLEICRLNASPGMRISLPLPVSGWKRSRARLWMPPRQQIWMRAQNGKPLRTTVMKEDVQLECPTRLGLFNRLQVLPLEMLEKGKTLQRAA